LYTSPIIIREIESRRMRWTGHVTCMGQTRKAIKILVRKPRHKWEDNIRMDLREMVWEGVDWMHLDQGRNQWQALVNTVMNLWVP